MNDKLQLESYILRNPRKLLVVLLPMSLLPWMEKFDKFLKVQNKSLKTKIPKRPYLLNKASNRANNGNLAKNVPTIKSNKMIIAYKKIL